MIFSCGDGIMDFIEIPIPFQRAPLPNIREKNTNERQQGTSWLIHGFTKNRILNYIQ
jgi:hypothetical protein